MTRRSRKRLGIGRLAIPSSQQADVLAFLSRHASNRILCRWDTRFGWDWWRLWEPESIDQWGAIRAECHYLHPTVGLALIKNGWVTLATQYECHRHYANGILNGIGFSRSYAIHARGLEILQRKSSRG
jgi:hypothetical protein